MVLNCDTNTAKFKISHCWVDYHPIYENQSYKTEQNNLSSCTDLLPPSSKEEEEDERRKESEICEKPLDAEKDTKHLKLRKNPQTKIFRDRFHPYAKNLKLSSFIVLCITIIIVISILLRNKY